METPLISIIIPVYNAETTLKKCVDSILAQTYDNYEIILINDGSRDDSLKICNDYALKNNKIKVIDQENQGVSEARNNGIERAVGKYITFIDSDDWIGKYYLERFNFFNFNADLYIEGIDYYFTHRGQYSNMFEYSDVLLNLNHSNMVFKLGLPLNGCPVAKLFLREKLITHNIRFNKDFTINEDHLFVTQYISKIQTVYFSSAIEYFYVYNISKNSLTKNYHSPETYLNIAHAMYSAFNITYGDRLVTSPDIRLAKYIFGPQQIIHALFSSEKTSSLNKYFSRCKSLWRKCNFNQDNIYVPVISKRLICKLLDTEGCEGFTRLGCLIIIKYDKMKNYIKGYLRHLIFR